MGVAEKDRGHDADEGFEEGIQESNGDVDRGLKGVEHMFSLPNCASKVEGSVLFFIMPYAVHCLKCFRRALD